MDVFSFVSDSDLVFEILLLSLRIPSAFSIRPLVSLKVPAFSREHGNSLLSPLHPFLLPLVPIVKGIDFFSTKEKQSKIIYNGWVILLMGYFSLEKGKPWYLRALPTRMVALSGRLKRCT
ncbi:hypothetical protein AVEN_103330-1 [Araneus ventricosus]|uniref:Uncharacterized protein n=1 Tax=Araneus ventricosus TaxID=182803 RepID=A0A4Y2LWS7_ARAVE|nr:hypothetical protein AVEN_103330-1 [Araneus ventricosus]